MRKELGLLNFICMLVALGFLALAVISVLSSGDFLTTDNLFIITVSLVMALMFVVSPLLYLKSEGKLPLPFVKRTPRLSSAADDGPAPLRSARAQQPLLDAKGRAVPPDVKAIMNRMNPTEAKDA
jgi:L-cystine uptake protein TcyP (sodium:dicarboxylate symporter family)